MNKQFSDEKSALNPDLQNTSIEKYYELIEVNECVLFETIEEARCHAPTDRHLWFVREAEYEDIEDIEDKFLWHLEGWRGQFVDRIGYCVTTRPRKPEHDDVYFGY